MKMKLLGAAYRVAIVTFCWIGLLLGTAGASTYNIDITWGSGSVVGSIETNKLGVLAQGDITAFLLQTHIGTSSLGYLYPVNGIMFINGDALTATGSGLFFDFGSSGSFAKVVNPFDPNGDINYICINASNGSCSGVPDVSAVSIFNINTPLVFTSVAESGLVAIGTFCDTCSSAAPLPAALPLFATGLGAFGLLGWRRKRKGNQN